MAITQPEPLDPDVLEMPKEPMLSEIGSSDSELWNPRSWSPKKKTLVCIGPIYTAFIG